MYSIDCNEFEEFTQISPKFYNKQKLAEGHNEKISNIIKSKFEASINKRFSSRTSLIPQKYQLVSREPAHASSSKVFELFKSMFHVSTYKEPYKSQKTPSQFIFVKSLSRRL